MKPETDAANFAAVGDYYRLLAAFLAPDKSAEQIAVLRSLIEQDRIKWKKLLYMANVQLCTPLWFCRLRDDGLLAVLPQELQDYLRHLHQANAERNSILRALLGDIAVACAAAKVPLVLLKGAAALCDNLYGDDGARIMSDADIMVRREDIGTAVEILTGLGFVKDENSTIVFDGSITDERHHHLPAFYHPQKKVVVELHFKVGGYRCGRLLPVEQAWENIVPARLDGTAVALLSPQWRIMHNCVHALVPDGEFIRGTVSLRQMAEFAALCSCYSSRLSWPQWRAWSSEHGFARQSNIYVALAQPMLPVTVAMATGQMERWHCRRILSVVNALRRKPPMVVTVYYYLNLPYWAWDNVCYARGVEHVPVRVICMLKKLLSGRSRAKMRHFCA